LLHFAVFIYPGFSCSQYLGEEEKPVAKVTIVLRVKLEDGKYPYLPAVMSGNGRLEPMVAEFNGRRKTFTSGTYYLRYLDGIQRYEAVGRDASVAMQRRIERSSYLESKAAGLSVAEPTKPVAPTVGPTLAETIERYNAEIRANKKPKTYSAYSNSLKFFVKSCTKPTAAMIDRDAMLEFKTFLRNTDMSKRSVYNNFLNVMVFMKWAKVVTGIGKGDWPPKPEREPEEYQDAEIEKLLNAADPEERLVLNCFLCSGLRSGELANATYGAIDFVHSTWAVRSSEDWDPKNQGSQRHIPIPVWLTKKLADRMEKSGRTKTDLIFFNRDGGVNHKLLRIVKRVAKRAGLRDIRVDDHKFRSTAITRWLRANNSPQDVMAWCGHKSLTTILRYAAKINVQNPEARSKATDNFAKFAAMGD
jgi:integrase